MTTKYKYKDRIYELGSNEGHISNIKSTLSVIDSIKISENLLATEKADLLNKVLEFYNEPKVILRLHDINTPDYKLGISYADYSKSKTYHLPSHKASIYKYVNSEGYTPLKKDCEELVQDYIDDAVLSVLDYLDLSKYELVTIEYVKDSKKRVSRLAWENECDFLYISTNQFYSLCEIDRGDTIIMNRLRTRLRQFFDNKNDKDRFRGLFKKEFVNEVLNSLYTEKEPTFESSPSERYDCDYFNLHVDYCENVLYVAGLRPLDIRLNDAVGETVSLGSLRWKVYAFPFKQCVDIDFVY